MYLKLMSVFILVYILSHLSTLSVLCLCTQFSSSFYCMSKSMMEMTALWSVNPKHPICTKGSIVVTKSNVARRYQSLLVSKFHYEFHILRISLLSSMNWFFSIREIDKVELPLEIHTHYKIPNENLMHFTILPSWKLLDDKFHSSSMLSTTCTIATSPNLIKFGNEWQISESFLIILHRQMKVP